MGVEWEGERAVIHIYQDSFVMDTLFVEAATRFTRSPLFLFEIHAVLAEVMTMMRSYGDK